MNDYKQVIVVRNDLKMRKGKFGAQCSHASEEWLRDRLTRLGQPMFSEGERKWFYGPMHTKIVLKCDSEAELLEILEKAKAKNVLAFLVTDAGLTEFDGPTKTCIGLGPADPEDFVGLTDHLKPA